MTKDEMPEEVRLQKNKGWGSVEEVVCGGTIYVRADLIATDDEVEEAMKRFEESNHNNDWQYKKDLDIIRQALQRPKVDWDCLKLEPQQDEYTLYQRGFNTAIDHVKKIMEGKE